MKKYIPHILLVLFACALILICLPKSCTTQPSELELKSTQSLKVDSIISAETEKHNAILDSIVSSHKKNDSIQKFKIETLSKKYYALRATLSKSKTVKIDSLNQVVEMPAIAYNASINSGNMCDSLLMYMDVELAIKDSIISTREIQLTNIKKEIEVKEQAKIDLIAVNNELKKKLKKSQGQNRLLKVALLIDTLLHFLH